MITQKVLRPMIYDRFISLGNFCEVAFQIRRYTKNEQAQFFDWLITPSQSVPEILETDFRHVFQRENMIVTEDGGAVVDGKYGIHYLHHFTKTADGKNSLEIVDREFGNQRAKFDYLIDRWRRMVSNENILFVWRGDPTGEMIGRVVHALEQMQGGRPVSLLIAHHETIGETLDHPGVVDVIVPPPVASTHPWEGDYDRWGEVFSRFPVHPPKVAAPSPEDWTPID